VYPVLCPSHKDQFRGLLSCVIALRHLSCMSDNTLSKFAYRYVDACGRHVSSFLYSSLIINLILCCPRPLGVLLILVHEFTIVHCVLNVCVGAKIVYN
jgi:hypothetical protein